MHLHHRHHHCGCYCHQKELKLQGNSAQRPPSSLKCSTSLLEQRVHVPGRLQSPSWTPCCEGKLGAGPAQPSGQRAACCPRVGLAALEGDAILVWCETAGLRGLALAQGWIPWLQQASLPSLTMASQRGRGRATRGGLGPGDLGLKILKGKNLGLKPEGTEI